MVRLSLSQTNWNSGNQGKANSKSKYLIQLLQKPPLLSSACLSWRGICPKNLHKVPHFWSFERSVWFLRGKDWLAKVFFSSGQLLKWYRGLDAFESWGGSLLTWMFYFWCLAFDVISERGEDLFSSVHISLVLSIWRDITRVVVC